MKETSLKRLLQYSSTIVIITITIIVSCFLIYLENRNFSLEIKKTENELLENKQINLKNRLIMILNELQFDQSLIKEYELSQIENFVNSMEKMLQLEATTNMEKIKKDLIEFKSNKEIHPFAFFEDGTLFYSSNSKDSEGKNYIDFEDINGFTYVKEIITKAKKGNKEPVEFTWYIPNAPIISTNITYTRYIPKLKLIVGAYMSKALINEKIKELLLQKISNHKFDENSFLYVDYLKSYNMSGDFTKELIGNGSKEYINIMHKSKIQEIISNEFLKNGFNQINLKDVSFKNDHFMINSLILDQYRWIITLGENTNKLFELKNLKIKKLEDELRSKIINLISLSITIAFIFFILSLSLVKKIEKLLINYQKKADIESNKYQALYQHSNDSFILANENFKIIDANLKAYKLTALTKENITKTTLDIFFPNIDFNELKCEKSGFFRTEFIDNNYNQKIVEFTFVWIYIEKERIIFVSIRDITERMKLIDEKIEQEQILIQQSKMAAMGEMIGNIAHQWRQPLSQISGLFMDLSSAFTYNELDEKYLKKIVNEADDTIEYMSRTIDDFRNFFNPNKTKENFLASDALFQAVKIIKSTFDFHGIKIDIKIENEKPIYGYPSEYSQVILNLFSNAKDILIERKIQNPKVNILIKIHDEKTCLKVIDNAGGIKQDILDRIFEPYFTTKYTYGTGIGLYMSKIIIEKNMKGIIRASNTKIGAKFVICV